MTFYYDMLYETEKDIEFNNSSTVCLLHNTIDHVKGIHIGYTI